MFHAMDFAIVVNDKKMKGSGLSRGDMVMITGLKPAPVKKSDPYLQRIFVVSVKVDEGKPLVPKDGNDYKAYLIDPRNLEKLPEDKQEQLKEDLKHLYG